MIEGERSILGRRSRLSSHWSGWSKGARDVMFADGRCDAHAPAQCADRFPRTRYPTFRRSERVAQRMGVVVASSRLSQLAQPFPSLASCSRKYPLLSPGFLHFRQSVSNPNALRVVRSVQIRGFDPWCCRSLLRECPAHCASAKLPLAPKTLR